MYEITRWVETVGDVKNFLILTGKFSKRFYSTEYREGEPPKKYWIYVEALAITRDLTYILKWNIDCSYDQSPPTEDTEGFPFGYIPTESSPVHRDFFHLWFPCIESGSCVDVFAYNGFTKVDEIKTDGNTKPLSSRW